MIAAPQAIEVLLDLTRAMRGERPVDALLADVTSHLLRLLPGRHASIRLLDETGTELVAGARAGEGADAAPLTFERGKGVIGWVAEHGQPARVQDCLLDGRFIPAPVQGFAIRSLLAVPMISGGTVIGVLAVTSPEVGSYAEDDELIAQLVANGLVPAVEGARKQRLSLTDPLTSTFNHRYLLQRLDVEFGKARKNGAPLSLLALDLDQFKQVNLKFRRDVGDQVLASFAERTSQVIRRCDVLVRRGGEEFVLVMPGATAAQAIVIANRIREVTASLPLQGGDQDVRVTVSVGVVEWDRVEDADQLDRRATAAVYEAKKIGKNHLVVGEPPTG